MKHRNHRRCLKEKLCALVIVLSVAVIFYLVEVPHVSVVPTSRDGLTASNVTGLERALDQLHVSQGISSEENLRAEENSESINRNSYSESINRNSYSESINRNSYSESLLASSAEQSLLNFSGFSKTSDGEISPASLVVEEEEDNAPAFLLPNTAAEFDNLTISEMNKLLNYSLLFPKSMDPTWASPVDKRLSEAKSAIYSGGAWSNDPELYPPLYRNISMFIRSYDLMEKMLKVYIYKEGERPIFHQPVIQGIYASEGWFMKLLVASGKYVTRNPKEAHLFYLPFSSKNLQQKLYVPESHTLDKLVQYLTTYLTKISSKYPFWNRTNGADHFLVACHDWAPRETKQQMSNCIRALCNSDINEGFTFGKDVSLPETLVRWPKHLERGIGGKAPEERSILAFFAGNMHGYLRPILVQQWGGKKDPEMRIYGRMPKTRRTMSYAQHMKSSKYCICARGYEVNSPRIVEAIYYECVPVIISDNFVPPLFSVLNWEAFAVFVLEKDIPHLKEILRSIPEERYLQLQMGVRRVRRHFVWHSKPFKYDLFHMTLHSIWLNRLLKA